MVEEIVPLISDEEFRRLEAVANRATQLELQITADREQHKIEKAQLELQITTDREQHKIEKEKFVKTKDQLKEALRCPKEFAKTEIQLKEALEKAKTQLKEAFEQTENTEKVQLREELVRTKAQLLDAVIQNNKHVREKDALLRTFMEKIVPVPIPESIEPSTSHAFAFTSASTSNHVQGAPGARVQINYNLRTPFLLEDNSTMDPLEAVAREYEDKVGSPPPLLYKRHLKRWTPPKDLIFSTSSVEKQVTILTERRGVAEKDIRAQENALHTLVFASLTLECFFLGFVLTLRDWKSVPWWLVYMSWFLVAFTFMRGFIWKILAWRERVIELQVLELALHWRLRDLKLNFDDPSSDMIRIPLLQGIVGALYVSFVCLTLVAPVSLFFFRKI